MPEKVVVIGRGSIGQRHFRVFSELVGRENVLHLSAGVRTNQSVSDIIDSAFDFHPDICVIASPATTHLSFLVSMLQRDGSIRFLVEKPLVASSNDELDTATIELLLLNRERIFVGYNLHYLPEFEFLYRHFKTIGDVLWADFQVGQDLRQWRPGRSIEDVVSLNPTLGGGALNELSHEIDLMTTLFGQLGVQSAQLVRGRFTDQVEEAVQLQCVAQGSIAITAQLDFYRAFPLRQVLIVGKAGSVSVDFVHHCAALEKDGVTKPYSFETVDSYKRQAETILGIRTYSNAPSLETAIDVCLLINQIKEIA